MKLIFAGCLLLLGVLAHTKIEAALSADQAKAALQMATDACTKEITLTPEERKLALENRLHDKDAPPPSENIKCFSRCFYKIIGLIGADGKPNVNDFTTIMQGFLKGKAEPSDILAKCKAVEGNDDCESIFNWGKCVDEQIKAVAG